MKIATVSLFLLYWVAAATTSRSQSLVNHKGTVIQLDTSKWMLSGSNIYNKNAGTVGVGTAGPANSNAGLEINFTNKGVLIPRVTLAAKNNVSPLSAHVAGMLVYNTATAGTAPNNVSPGFYYNTGSAWARVMEQTAPFTDTTSDGWKENAANSQVKLAYLSDGSSLRTAGTEFVVGDDGKVGIGTAAPSWLLDVQGLNALGQFKRIGGTAAQAPGLLFTRTLGFLGAESNIAAGNYLGKIQFRGRLSGSDADYASLCYVADATSAGGGHFGFTRSDLTTEVMTITTDDNRVGIGVSTPNSTLDVNGSISADIIDISGATTLDETHCYVVAGNNATYTITLPAAGTCEGRVYHIRVNGTGTKSTTPSYLRVNGTTSTTLTTNAVTNLVSNGTSWYQF